MDFLHHARNLPPIIKYINSLSWSLQKFVFIFYVSLVCIKGLNNIGLNLFTFACQKLTLSPTPKQKQNKILLSWLDRISKW